MLFYVRTVACFILRIQMLLEPKSPRCNSRGAFDPCGTCKCGPDYYGDKCECLVDYRIPDQETALAACTSTGSTVPCNGRGDCKCGYCECSLVVSGKTDKYYGRTCKCDDVSCPMYDDKLCGGHGRCFCGKCDCNTGYTGDACDKKLIPERDQRNQCLQASSCDECFKMESSCGWYKQMESSSGVESRCNLYDNHLMNGVSADDILTSQTTPDTTTIVEYQSDQCSGRGSINVCGECVCNDDMYGRTCECDARLVMSPDQVLSQCIRPNSTYDAVCSGRGECICGYCSCFARRSNSAQRYNGRYCQCDDYSCSYHDNKICGGHGQCICGVCSCEQGFIGDACDCPISHATCLSTNGKICNGVGSCECGICVCTGMFRGPTCEECPTCLGLCETYKNCAFCKLGTGAYSAEECYNKCSMAQLVDVVGHGREHPNEKLCKFRDSSDGFYVHFSYSYVNGNQVKIKVQTTKTST